MTDTKLLSGFLDDVVKQIDELKIVRRVVHRYPFDSLATQLVTTSISLGRAIAILLNGGFDNEAYGLSRSIVECALTLRYITAEQSLQGKRTIDFVRQSKKDRDLWLYVTGLQDLSKEERHEIEAYASKQGYTPDGKSAHSHWSGERNFIQVATSLVHPLDPADLEANYHRIARAADYYHPSCFVHCTQPALENSIDFEEPYLRAIVYNGEKSYDIGRRAKIVAFQYIKQVVLFVLYGMNMNPPASFTCLIDYRYCDDLKDYRRFT